MTNPPPPELFPQRPTPSDFADQRPYRKRRAITLLVLLVVAGVGLYLKYGRAPETPAMIPVISAAGPLKQKPEQPGGVVIPNQNVMAYQQISGANKPQADHLLPPPATPKPVAAGAAPSAPVPTAPASKFETLQPPPLPKLATTAVQPDHAAAVTPAAPAPAAAPVSKVEKAASTAVASTAPSAPAPAIKSVTPAPAAMPAKTPPAPAPVAAPPAPKATPPVAAAAKPVEKAASGGKADYRVQLASIPDEGAAHAAARKLQKKYASALGAARLHLAKADLGPRGIYYRVQSSLIDKNEALRICADVKRHGTGCIVVRH